MRYWFKPRPDITTAEFAEIFQATFMSLSSEYWAKLTAEAQRHFEKGPDHEQSTATNRRVV